MIKCGIYEIDITPNLGHEVPGQFYKRKSDGVKEPLCCEAVYFENNGSKAVIFAVDILMMSAKFCGSVRERVAEALDMPGEAVMLSATHSHTAGPIYATEGHPFINDYMEFLAGRMVSAATIAASEAREVVLSYAVGYEDKLGYCRNFVEEDGRYHTWGGTTKSKPLAEPDHDVCVLRIDNTDGSPYGVIANHACHCDCVGGTQYSSDYPGEMRRLLRVIYGQNFKPVFINGFAGNINHNDPCSNFSKEIPSHYKRMGRMLAADVVRTREMAVKPFEDETVAGQLDVMVFSTRVPDAELVKWAEGVLANPNANDNDRSYANGVKRYEKINGKPEDVPVQVIKIGELAIYGMPGEAYSDYGKMLKSRSPLKYNIPAYLSNGDFGYIPTLDAYHPGIYEARIGANKLEPNAGNAMVDRLIELAQKL